MKLLITNLCILFLSCHAEPLRGKEVTRRLEEECRAVIQDINYGPQKKSKENLMCETPSGLVYKVKNYSQDDIDLLKKSIDNSDREGPLLTFDSPAHINGETQEIENDAPPKLVGRPNHSSRKLAKTTGTKSVLVVRVVTSDKMSPSSSLNALSDSVFGNNADGNGSDTMNLKSQYAKCSHNKLDFVEASDRNGNGVNIRNGAVEIKISRSSTENEGLVVNAVTTQLQALFGVYPNQLADHVMYCLPPLSTSWGIAYAYINSWNSVYHDEWCSYLSTQMHEIGHNLGLAHSGESDAYDDQSGMMGYSYPELDGPEMCFNAAKSWQLGWYNSRHVTLELNEAYYGKLGSIVHGDSDPSPAIIKINNSGSSTDYYITFNWAYDFNSGTAEGGNQVLVVETGSEGSGYSPSDLLGKQFAGTRTYTLGTKTVTVKVNSINTSTGYANVEICYGVCLNAPTRAPTLKPTKQPTHPTSEPTRNPTSAPTPNSWLACRTAKANKKAKECLKIQGCTWVSGQCKPSIPEPTANPSKKPTVTVSVMKVSDSPTRSPTVKPTRKPYNSTSPTKGPTDAPTPSEWQRCRTKKANKKAKDCLKISGCTWFQNSCRHSSSVQGSLDEFTPTSDDCVSKRNKNACRSSASCVWKKKACMRLN